MDITQSFKDWLSVPRFSENQLASGDWVVQYKWMHPLHGFMCDAVIVPEVDRERGMLEARLKVTEMCLELIKTLS
jgi:hypothetical protein